MGPFSHCPVQSLLDQVTLSPTRLCDSAWGVEPLIHMVKTLNSLRNIPFCLCWEPYWLSIVNIYVPVNKAEIV